jgi:hypothetical protein
VAVGQVELGPARGDDGRDVDVAGGAALLAFPPDAGAGGLKGGEGWHGQGCDGALVELQGARRMMILRPAD